MDVLKRNLGLFAFCLASVVLAMVLLVMTQRHVSQASEYEKQVAELETFFGNLRRLPVSATESNVQVMEANYEQISNRLERVRGILWRRSNIPVRQYTGVECKNILREETLRMRNLLEGHGIVVAPAVSGFSFESILAADALPSQQEVPVILKQLEIVKEIVRLTDVAGVFQLTNLERTMGLQSHAAGMYNVVPFKMTVAGPLRDVKELVTMLQKNSGYVFYVPYCTLLSDDQATREAARRPVASTEKRPAGASREYEMMMMTDPALGMTPRGGRTARPRRGAEAAAAEEAEPAVLEREQRIVDLNENVQAEIRIDFIEFNNPNAKKEASGLAGTQTTL